MGLRSLLIVALFALSSFGAEAKISGPSEAQPGDLVVISGKQSTGKAFQWVMPAGMQTLSCSELEFGFAVGESGVYSFTLIAADTDDLQTPIAIATHTVRIGEVAEPVPDPEPDRPTPPPSNLEELRILSKESAAKLADQTTARGLSDTIQSKASEIAAMCENGQCPTLDGAKRLMVIAIENRLLARTGLSRNVNWADGWRVPINAGLRRLDTQTVAAYLTAMRAVAVGLSES